MRAPAILIAAIVLGTVAPAVAQEIPSGADSLVIVEMTLAKRDDLKKSPEEMGYDHQRIRREAKRVRGTPLEYPGVVVGEGEILISDPHLEPEDWGAIMVRTRDGRRIPGRLAGVLPHAPGLLITGEPKDLPAPVRFEEKPAITFGMTVRAIWLARYYDRVNLYTGTGTLSGFSAEGLFLSSGFRTGSLLLDAEGKSIGVVLGRVLYSNGDGRSTFVGSDLLRSPGLPWDDFEKRIATARERFTKSLVRVRIEYRLPEKDEGARMSFRNFGSSGGAGDTIGYGVAIGDGRVFLPHDPGFERIRQIKRVVAVRGDGADTQETEGRFLGSFRRYGGLMLEFPGIPGLLPATLAAEGAPGRFDLLLLAKPERKFGKDHVVLRASRYRGDDLVEEWGREKRRPALNVTVGAGNFILDLDARVRGFVTLEKDEEAEGGTGAGRLSRYYEQPVQRIYWHSDVAAAWKEPNGHYDPRAKPRSRLMAKRGVWLGVEFQHLTKPLARELGIQDATRDGERGYLISLVYPDSPAERLGLLVGDVLLHFREVGKPAAERKELIRPEYFGWGQPFGPTGRGRFAGRSNSLTTLLTGLGEGKNVVVTYLRGKEERSSEIVLSKAPADFTSAPKWKSERLGLTVKELTYEVRAYYRLPADYRGVIVSVVKSGSPGELGEIFPLDIINLVNGEPVHDTKHFRELVEKALDDGVESLTFFAKRLTGTRFLEVKPDEKTENTEEKSAPPVK
jgi:hypothetical protein